MTIASYFAKFRSVCCRFSGRAARVGRAAGALYHEVHGRFKAIERLPQAPVVVRLADEPGLARVGLAEHAEVVKVRRQCFVESVIARDPVAVGAGRFLAEEQAAHGGMAAEGML